LRYWIEETQVDGFRFDLGTILAREPNGFDTQSGFLKVCSQDPVLSTVKLIAEPWDCGPGGYQVGEFPPGWAEWNDKFRDTVRDFWKSSATPGQLAPRLCASGDLFNKRGRKPWASINFVTAHDGFTLADVVSYNEKHNEANGEANNDGTANNHSWNCGAEGPAEDPGIRDLRDRQMRNLLATLILAQGTPMLLAGDEFARTQSGNNNAYCQDNKISWVNWTLLSRNAHLMQFVQRLTYIRNTYPVLRRTRFLTGVHNEVIGVRDVMWITHTGSEMQQEDWDNAAIPSFGMLIDGRAQSTAIVERGSDATVILLLNGGSADVSFTLPTTTDAQRWMLLLDTNKPERGSANVEREYLQPSESVVVVARSFLAFVLETSVAPQEPESVTAEPALSTQG